MGPEFLNRLRNFVRPRPDWIIKEEQEEMHRLLIAYLNTARKSGRTSSEFSDKLKRAVEPKKPFVPDPKQLIERRLEEEKEKGEWSKRKVTWLEICNLIGVEEKLEEFNSIVFQNQAIVTPLTRVIEHEFSPYEGYDPTYIDPSKYIVAEFHCAAYKLIGKYKESELLIYAGVVESGGRLKFGIDERTSNSYKFITDDEIYNAIKNIQDYGKLIPGDMSGKDFLQRAKEDPALVNPYKEKFENRLLEMAINVKRGGYG